MYPLYCAQPNRNKNIHIIPSSVACDDACACDDRVAFITKLGDQWIGAWRKPDVAALKVFLSSAGEGGGGVKPPICAQNLKSITKFCSSFYIIGQTVDDCWCCSCPEFGKTLQCKHSTAIAIEKGLPIPDQFNQTKIGGTKRPCGRPRKRPLEMMQGDDGEF